MLYVQKSTYNNGWILGNGRAVATCVIAGQVQAKGQVSNHAAVFSDLPQIILRCLFPAVFRGQAVLSSKCRTFLVAALIVTSRADDPTKQQQQHQPTTAATPSLLEMEGKQTPAKTTLDH